MGRYLLNLLEVLGTGVINGLDAVGGLVVAGGRRLLRWARRMCFGSPKRMLITLVIAGLALASHYPKQSEPYLTPLLTTAVLLVAARVMLHPYWPKAKKKKKRARN